MKKAFTLLGMTLALGVSLSGQAPPPSLTTLHSFTGQNGDGSLPSGLTFGNDGVLYGTTAWGGNLTACSLGCGTIFQLTPVALGGGWTETVLYQFTGENGESDPAGVVASKNGELFGALGSAYTNGIVYELAPPAQTGGAWSLTIPYIFTGSPDGSDPSSLVIGPDGSIYGVTFTGGVASCPDDPLYGGCGIVFQLAPPVAAGGPWTEHILHTFLGGTDGAAPLSVVMGQTGTLYGTTLYGGTEAYGTAFQLTPPVPGGGWTYSVLYNFGCCESPNSGLVAGADGRLYGTTFAIPPHAPPGYGPYTVYELKSPAAPNSAWTKTILYSFPSSDVLGTVTDGLAGVFGGTGTLYGNIGGARPGFVFSLTPPATPGKWTGSVLHGFTGGSDGSNPSGVIVGKSGALYGTTAYGGTGGWGTVFELTP
jgi:hypothetical protein